MDRQQQSGTPLGVKPAPCDYSQAVRLEPPLKTGSCVGSRHLSGCLKVAKKVSASSPELLHDGRPPGDREDYGEGEADRLTRKT